MLSVIGLVLEAIGAIGLTIGLFRAPLVSRVAGTRPTGVEISAENRAYGVVGGLFLLTRFCSRCSPTSSIRKLAPAPRSARALADDATVNAVPLLVLR